MKLWHIHLVAEIVALCYLSIMIFAAENICRRNEGQIITWCKSLLFHLFQKSYQNLHLLKPVAYCQLPLWEITFKNFCSAQFIVMLFKDSYCTQMNAWNRSPKVGKSSPSSTGVGVNGPGENLTLGFHLSATAQFKLLSWRDVFKQLWMQLLLLGDILVTCRTKGSDENLNIGMILSGGEWCLMICNTLISCSSAAYHLLSESCTSGLNLHSFEHIKRENGIIRMQDFEWIFFFFLEGGYFLLFRIFLTGAGGFCRKEHKKHKTFFCLFFFFCFNWSTFFKIPVDRIFFSLIWSSKTTEVLYWMSVNSKTVMNN